MRKLIQISIAPFFLFFFCFIPAFAHDPCEPLVVMALKCTDAYIVYGSATNTKNRSTEITHWKATCEKTLPEWTNEFVTCRTEHPLPADDSEFLKLTPDPESDQWDVSTFRLSDREQVWIYSKSGAVLKHLGESVQKFINEGDRSGTSPKTVQRRQQHQMLKSLQSFQQNIEYQIEEQKRLRPPSHTEEFLKKQEERERLEEETLSALEEKLRSRLDEIYLKEESAIREAENEILPRDSATPQDDTSKSTPTILDEWKERITELHRDKKYAELYQEIDDFEKESRLMNGLDVPEPILSLLNAKKEILSHYIHEVSFYQLAERLGIENAEGHEGAVVQKLFTEISELRKDDRAITILDTAEIALTTSDSSFRENEKQLGYYWTNIGSALIEHAKTALNIVTSWTPFVNDARDFYELVTGKDLIYGESIGASGRTFAAVGLLIGSGVLYRRVAENFKKTITKILGKSEKKIFEEAENWIGTGENWVRKNADEINSLYHQKGLEPPWKSGIKVFEFKLKNPVSVWRVHADESKTLGDWVMHIDPKTLSKQDVADQFSLPLGVEGLKYISKFELPAGTIVRGGITGKNKWGKGGQIQWEILSRVQRSWLKNTAPY